jgi:hypothetical protein
MNDYDPMKELNKTKYLNDAFIKSRYSLLHINENNIKKGRETGSHWKKFIKYPVLDEDMKKRFSDLENENLKKLNIENDKIINRVKKSKVREYINSIDHTKEYNDIIKRIKTQNGSDINFIRESLKVPLLKKNHKLIKKKKIYKIKINDDLNFNNNNKHLKPFSFMTVSNFHKKNYNYHPKYYYYIGKKGKCVFDDKNTEENEIDINFNVVYNSENVSIDKIKNQKTFKSLSPPKRKKKGYLVQMKLNKLIQDFNSCDFENKKSYDFLHDASHNHKTISKKDDYTRNNYYYSFKPEENIFFEDTNYTYYKTFDRNFTQKKNSFNFETNNAIIKKLKIKLGNKINNIKV